jgi:Na+/glutamate symporter
MSFAISRALNAGAVMAGVIGTVTGLAGVVGVIVTAPAYCPESIAAASCRNAATKAAGLATQGLITAGVAGLMVCTARVIDPEA